MRWAVALGVVLPTLALAQAPPAPTAPSMAEELTVNAREAAAKGQCAGVQLVGERVRELDPTVGPGLALSGRF